MIITIIKKNLYNNNLGLERISIPCVKTTEISIFLNPKQFDDKFIQIKCVKEVNLVNEIVQSLICKFKNFL